MAKYDIKCSKMSKGSNNAQKRLNESQVKADLVLKKKPPVLSDNNRVVFSEEINRDSDMDDG